MHKQPTLVVFRPAPADATTQSRVDHIRSILASASKPRQNTQEQSLHSLLAALAADVAEIKATLQKNGGAV